MTLNVVKKSKYIEEELLENVVKEVFSYLDEEFEVNIKFVNEDYIKNLNMEYRGKNEPTNVLSFNNDSERGGDIVICEDIVDREAKNLNYEPKELSLLYIIHGTLHLAGFDHTNKKDRAKMETAESEILSKIGVNIERD